MAVYPGANYRPIAPGSNDPPITVIGAILHVDAGNSKSLYGYFKDKSGGIESHFHIPKEGEPEQYRDTGREADANLKANSFIKNGKRYGYVSIETQGFGTGKWNDHQLAEIKALLLWLSKTHKFPLKRCPAHTEPGVGYHVMFGAPGPWTPVAKSCPGPDRVKQFNTVLVPWFKDAGSTPKPPASTPQEPTVSDIYYAHLHAKESALKLEDTMRELDMTPPNRPAETGSGDAYFAHYWAKYSNYLADLVKAKAASL